MLENEIINCIVIILAAGSAIWIGYIGYTWYIDSRAAREVQQEHQNSLLVQKKLETIQ